MKKILTTTVALLGAHLLVTAGPVTPQKAKLIAEQVLGQSPLRSGGTIELTYTHTPQVFRQANGEEQPYYYVFNRGASDGFAIVAGDDRMHSVLAHADKGHFDVKSLPEHIKAWMQQYDTEIEQLLQTPDIFPSARTQSNTSLAYPITEPLLGKIKWNQDYPYNHSTPTDKGVNMPTGCVATAAAQIMRYHKWPDQSVGSSFSYYDNFSRSSRTATFGGKYNWDKMPEAYTQGSLTYTKENAKEVGDFMRDLGLGAQMSYSASASGAWEHNLATTLRNNFKYRKDLSLKIRYNHTQKEWEDLIQEELKAKRPVFYTGYGNVGGHAFVCDGYNKDGLYHFNWGWGGMANGYFRLTALKPTALGIGAGLGDYSLGQVIIVGFTPDKDSSSKEGSKLIPSASIRVQLTQDKEAMMLKGKLFQRSEEMQNGKLRVSIKAKNGNLSKFSKENVMNLPFRDPKDFTENLAVSSYENGEYELYLEWQENGTSEYKPLSMCADEPDKLFFTIEDKKVKEWSYNAPTDILTFDKSKTVADLKAFSTSKLTVTIENKSDREYYGPVKVYAMPSTYTAETLAPTGREEVVAEAVVCVPAKSSINHTFEEFKFNHYENTQVNLYLQYAQMQKGVPNEEFGHHTTRLSTASAYLCGEKVPVTVPADYSDVTFVCTPSENVGKININLSSFTTPSFKIKNRGKAYTNSETSVGIIAVLWGNVQGNTTILAVASNYAPGAIQKGEEVVYTPKFDNSNKVKYMQGRTVWVQLHTLYISGSLQNTFADKDYPLFGKTSITASVVKENSIEQTEAVKATLFPNPAASTLRISNATQILSVDIFAMDGQLMLSHKGEGKEEVALDVHALPEGNYLVGVRDANNKVSTLRLMIAR